MRACGGLAWLALYLILRTVVGTQVVSFSRFARTIRMIVPAVAESQVFDLPHSHQEERHYGELHLGLSACAYSVTGSFSGPPVLYVLSPSDRFLSFSSAMRNDYDGGSFSLS